MIVCATENYYSVLLQLKNLSVFRGIVLFFIDFIFYADGPRTGPGPDRYLKYRTTPVEAVGPHHYTGLTVTNFSIHNG